MAEDDPPKTTKTTPAVTADPPVEDPDSQLIHNNANNEISRLITITCLLVILSYVLGYFQFSFTLPCILCAYVYWLAKDKIDTIYKCLDEEHCRREHRRRALEHAETVEWFNTLLNRWWCFSGNQIDEIMKQTLDPLLQSCKPKIVENIEVENFSLGTRTPYLKYVKVYEMTDDMRKEMASEITNRNPPADILARQKYQIAIDADMGLDAPQSQLNIRIKLLGKLGYTDVMVEQFKIRGRLQIVLFFNQNIPFPHLAAFSFTFLNAPKVSFEIKMLKSIKLMEFPVIRKWIEELVNDSLKISLVDPGHVTIPLCNDPEIIGRQVGYASGVLTITVKGGAHGKATSDEQWCSITLDKQKIRTKEITSDVQWQEQVSMLVCSLQFDKLRIKIKGKRRFGPDYTVVEYVLPLVRLNLEQDCEQKMNLHDDNIEGSDLDITLNYYSLPVLDLSNDTDDESFRINYIEKNIEGEPDEVSGVLFVRVHKGISLIPMDSSGTSDPYVMVFANSEMIHLGHVVQENLNPVWDTMIEFFTLDYTQTTLSFVLHDRDNATLPHVLLADESDDFMGSCNLPLHKEDWCTFKKALDVQYKIYGDQKKGVQESLRKVGKIIVSVIFRPVSSIKNSVRGTKNSSLQEGESIYQKRTKIDAITMEAMLRTERGSLTICLLRARNLVALDLNGRSDPFVIIRIGNTKQEKFKSKVVYRTLNPVWNEQVTLAMPQKHEKVMIEVWDKDPFSQEKMGRLIFGYNDLINLGQGDVNEKHWFNLEDARSGELQLAFQAVAAECALSDTEDGVSYHHSQERIGGLDSNEDEDDADGYLIYEGDSKKAQDGGSNDKCASISGSRSPSSEHKRRSLPAKLANHDHPATLSKENGYKSVDATCEEVFTQDKKDDVVDFSGEPMKYFGIYGKIIEVTNLVIHEDIDEIYIKAKLDRHAKFTAQRRNLLRNNDKILCKTTNLKVEPRIIVNEDFQMKSDIGISPGIYLILEVKSDKKGKDVIDSHSILLRSIFKGESSVIRIIELDNGGKMKIQMGHSTEPVTLRPRYKPKRVPVSES